MSAAINQPLKWHGGKNYLAQKIIALMPPRCKTPNKPEPGDSGWLHYVEPYFGGGAVLLANDPEGISEVVNDLNHDLALFWQILQCPSHFADFQRRLEATGFSEYEYDLSNKNRRMREEADDPVDQAVDFYISCRQSLAGRMKGFTAITKTRTRRGMNNEVSAWLTAVEGLPEVHARLKRVLILNRDAMDVIRSQDGPQTLFYLDPPYLHETRATTTEYGEHEMSWEEHEELLFLLGKIKGRFLLSGYLSELYNQKATIFRWHRHDFELPNQAAGGKNKRRMTECVWTNY